jgi:Ca-activated chloride channel family protein
LPEVLKMAEQSSTVIYTIGIFDPTEVDRNPGVLKRLADETGGEAFFPRELDDVVAICEKIARDIRSQYTVGYVPGSAAPAGRYRRVRVTARAAGNEKLDARTRSGYLAAGSR